jgi:hypothetical protein
MRRGAAQETLQSISDKGEMKMNMSADFRKRRKIPFQACQEVTIPPNTVTGFGVPSSPISGSPYDGPNDPTRPQVDPIQVGPTG